MGFIKVASAIPSLRVADCDYNAQKVKDLIVKADGEGVEIVCFPELSITSYSCADLFFQKQLLDNAENALGKLMSETADLAIISLVGMPVRMGNQLFNCAVVFHRGEILAVVPKINLPNNDEFYEKRWFASGAAVSTENITLAGQETFLSANYLFKTDDFSFAVEICEDLWSPVPPSSKLAVNGAEIIFNLSASNELVGKHAYRRQLVEQQSARCHCGYVYASAGYGESTTDLVFSGNAFIAENGKLLAESERFSFEPQLVITEIDVERLRAERLRNSNFSNERDYADCFEVNFSTGKKAAQKQTLTRQINPYPFIPSLEKRDETYNEISSIQVAGLAKRWQHTLIDKLIIGVSGGLDSTLALLICAKTADKLGYDRKRILGVTMPGFGTTDRTYNNARELMKSLGISTLDINIKEACLQHFKDIGHDPEIHDVTYENVQARERTQILMDLANKQNGLVVGTGDLSEMALGWSTYNGDHMSMYAVNSGIPKTLVRHLVNWISEQMDQNSAKILQDILDTPVSPELLPGDEKGEIKQKTEDIIGPYELHDFYLYYFVRFGFTPEKIQFLAKTAFGEKYSCEEIDKWLKLFLKRFFQQQFKRSCTPDGPKIGSVNLSPRGDWRMPSDAIFGEW
ncbi:MAG: NAD(+) synthase [Porphyromonadaceae bacterium]|jgi:NAD+ synthase (glutamine-hydrolysing)|nr:NAD(+) synthase [Porphyromonadaceae bacterium]